MKLRNKLIPLATVFATSAVVAPTVLTSCSNAGGMVDLSSGNYVPSIKKAVTEGYEATEDAAMQLWMSSINENPETFIQDRYWGDAAVIKGFADLASINATSIKGQCKDVSVKYVTIKDGTVDKKIPTVSMTYTLVMEFNWSVTGVSEPSVDNYAQTMAGYGLPLYYPFAKYRYDDNIAGKINSSVAYEAKWTNIPVAFFEFEEAYKPYLPKVLTNVTQWSMQPKLDYLNLMDSSKLDWSYSVKYAKEDTFIYDKDGKETSKVNASSLDRSFNNYYNLISGPISSKFYTNAGDILQSEMIASYYLSDLTKVTE